ncbi:hypothetical protein J3R30DRAFT_3710873 [Lentinula aciculospora]|uniref:Uncharacterized protein n=1 Tax=Lentinula aciculospora TaxID=153920 RepID=A0A9W8ZZE0_9AGAR|nr:hypothetical protein J3R30DRAFT_3710873 [Lentinula aciculospora]
MFLLFVFTAVWSTSLWLQVRCQNQSPNVPACSSQYDYQWSVNSKRQSPCQVAGYLGSACLTGGFTIPAVIPGEYYSLSSTLQNNCTCSTVYYSTLSACATCQGATYITQDNSLSNSGLIYIFQSDGRNGQKIAQRCSSIDIQTPFRLVQLSLTGRTRLYPVQLHLMSRLLNKQEANLPESSAAATTSTTTSGSSTPSAATETNTPVSTASSAPSSDKHKINYGAIAGGVVGGLALLCIVILIFVFACPCRRRKIQDPRSASPSDVDMTLAMPTPFTLHHSQDPLLRQYNPSDPNTDPSSEDTRPGSQYLRDHYMSWSGTSARYSGTAEI